MMMIGDESEMIWGREGLWVGGAKVGEVVILTKLLSCGAKHCVEHTFCVQ